MEHITRDIEGLIGELMKKYPCILVVGPYNVGKKTTLKQICGKRSPYQLSNVLRRYLLSEKLSENGRLGDPPICFHDIQFMPSLLSFVKEAISNGAGPGSFLMSGSPSAELVKNAKELLGNDVAVLHMSGLSQYELSSSKNTRSFPFTLEHGLLSVLSLREKANREEIYRRIWMGSLPQVYLSASKYRNSVFTAYIQNYFERHLSAMVSPSDQLKFLRFIINSAHHVGEILDLKTLAESTGIAEPTAKLWFRAMEETGLVFCIEPYSGDGLGRTAKKPKMYFSDTGLLTFLTRIDKETQISEAVFENYVVLEIIKSYWNCGKEAKLWYYHDRRGRNIDLIIESNGMLQPIEINLSGEMVQNPEKKFSVLDKGLMPRGNGAIICITDVLKRIDGKNMIVPVWMI